MAAPHKDFYEFPSELKATDIQLAIKDWPYKIRRKYCWETFDPRFERFTYKYASLDPLSDTSIARAKNILIDSCIWLSAPQDFNDPFDCQAQITNEPNALKRRRKVDQLLRSFEPHLNGLQRKRKVDQLMTRPAAEWFEVVKNVLQEETKFLGVTCFSDDPRSLLMWSHYAINHTGICYQFETLNDVVLFSRAMAVQYTKIYPTLNPFTHEGDDSIRMLLSKYEDWKYEKERRVVAPGGAHKFLRFAPASLSGIILGTRIQDASLRKLREILSERTGFGFPAIRVFKAEQHPSEYRLTLRQLHSFL